MHNINGWSIEHSPVVGHDADTMIALVDVGMAPSAATTRREFLVGGLVVVTVGALAGCGSDADQDVSAATPTIDDSFGDVEIPANPTRIIAADEIALGNMLALDVQPVGGVWYTDELAPHLAAQVDGDIVNVAPLGEMLMETIVELDPELALIADFDEDQCQQLRAAVSTFCYRYGYETEADVLGNLREVATVLDKSPEAELLIGEYEQAVELLVDVAADTGWTGRQVGIVYVDGSADMIYLVNDGSGAFVLDRLGIAVHDGTPFDGLLSAERLDVLDENDAVIAYNWGGQAVRDELAEHPVWRNLDVVTSDRVVWVDGPVWYGYDYLALMQIVADIREEVLTLRL